MIEHPFEDGYRWGDQLICTHVEGSRVCGKAEAEHASAEVGGEPVQDGERVGPDGGEVE
jgi:hypothetical protein